MEYRTEQIVTRKKRIIKIISGAFIGLLMILTLFSNTLANWDLPKVTTGKLRIGKLTQTFTGNGELEPQEEAKLSSSSSEEAKVKEVHVKEGDSVKKNQILVTYDSKKSEQEILDAEAMLQISKLALNEAQTNYNEAKKNQQENKANNQSFGDTSIQSLKTAVEVKKIEISMQERKIKNLKEELEIHKKLIAPFDGVVTKINAKKDQPSVKDEGDVILFNESKGFKVELQVPSDLAMHVKVGEKIEMKANAKSLEGELMEIKSLENYGDQRLEEQGNQQGEQIPVIPQPQKRLLVKVQGEELKKGDQVEAKLTKQFTNKGLLIPNSVIQRGAQGEFVYTIEEKKGSLGNAFYITESPIILGESNGLETVVLQGVYEREQIVLNSSEPLKKGERVKVK